MVVWDPPFQLGRHDSEPGWAWDVWRPNEEMTTRLLDSLKKSSKGPFFMYIHTHRYVLGDICAALTKNSGYKWDVFSWVKFPFHQPRIHDNKWATMSELIITVEYDRMGERKATDEFNSLVKGRNNTLIWPHVPSSKKYSIGSGTFNATQKPIAICKYFASVQLGHSWASNVLVLGSGSGSEVLGALANGNSVTAIEIDAEQHMLTLTRLKQARDYHDDVTQGLIDNSLDNPTHLLYKPDVVPEPFEPAYFDAYDDSTVQQDEKDGLSTSSSSSSSSSSSLPSAAIAPPHRICSKCNQEPNTETECTQCEFLFCEACAMDWEADRCPKCVASDHEQPQDPPPGS